MDIQVEQGIRTPGRAEVCLGVVVAIAIASLLVCVPALGATIRVAADGSGQFESVFDACAAASEGDTISIAPGEYTEPQPDDPGEIVYEFMGVLRSSNVTVIGDSRDSVLIGPPEPPPIFTDSGVIGLVNAVGTTGIVYRNLTLRNLSQAIADGDGAPKIYDCRFVGNYQGITQTGLGRFEMINCEFIENRTGIILYSGWGTREAYIDNCTFQDSEIEALEVQNSNTWVRRIVIDGGVTGVTTTLGGDLLLEESRIHNISTYGLFVSNASGATLVDCSIEGAPETTLWVSGAFVASGSSFAGGTYTTFHLGGTQYAEVTGSHILNAGGQSIIAVATVQNPRTFNFENNWWGTADSTQVEEWIFHAPDDPEETGLTIDYSPLAHEPVPTERSSLGGLKGRFRRTGSSGQE